VSTYASADPATVEQELETTASLLDSLGKDLDEAVDAYNAADEAWLILYDQVAEDLREEYQQAGRKTDPAEHVITSTTRKQHRVAYTEWKRAKRDLERIKQRMQSLGKVVSARQTQSNGLRDEIKAGVYSR
jgi:hypothetical protein